MPSPEQIQHGLQIFIACTVCVGACGTALEALGNKLKSAKMVSVGRMLEDFATNIPRLLGKEKRD